MDDINLSNRNMSSWLPYVISAIGIFSSIFLWMSLSYPDYLINITSIKNSMQWIALLLGVCFVILFLITWHLFKLSQQRSETLSLVNQNFKKELLEHTEAEEAKQKLEKALLQGQKLQAVGTLAGGIAHDFNNILYAIIGYVEMAREDVKKETQVHDNLGKVLDAAKRGQDLISRILSFSRRQHREFHRLQIQATIENILELLKPTVPASVHIIFQPLESDFSLMGDQTELHQVIVNLINNAVDAMDGEGTITIKICHLSPDDELLKQLPKMTAQNYFKIDVSDTGRGMDPATIERVFEPFFTTKEVGKGTGLGLSTVHAIITEHQGKVIVNSQLGQGTTFTLILPEFKE